ncbi:RING-H2 finger protein ATL5H [Panicum miliaceum]|uniref:RING-type E3 ubiquitin transferase n=1 Tax=Panicum miliaceum TaxID=4540 RepID=A0A3L6RPE2_PANMI|nr:RING-H2 finger protein ATL5H [Panicum miliaceum]
MATSRRDGTARAHDTFLNLSGFTLAITYGCSASCTAYGRRRRRYGIVVATASLLLFTILAATVSLAKAGALAGAAAVVFGAAGCVSRCCAAGGGAGPALPTTVAPARARAACGLVDAAIDVLPAFAYARAGACAAEGGGSSKSGRPALCPVCLEDVEAGEMVRQLPACRHLFHVECIDMWLHSHATCPLCRCLVSPRQVGAKHTAAGDPPDDVPPV